MAAAKRMARCRRVRRSLRPSDSATGSATRPINRPRRDRDAGIGAPDWIACRTLERVLRRAAEAALPIRTSRTGQPAITRCHGFTAMVGDPTIVATLDAASRGASRTPVAKPRATATKPRTADSKANTAVIWRGVTPTAFSNPISRCCALARAVTRIATTAKTTASRTIVYVVSTS
jgi:hypothetical protein